LGRTFSAIAVVVAIVLFASSCQKNGYPCPAMETPAEAKLRKQELAKQDPKKENKSKNKYDQNGRLIKKSYTHSGLRK
jgi:hypothetical protein